MAQGMQSSDWPDWGSHAHFWGKGWSAPPPPAEWAEGGEEVLPSPKHREVAPGPLPRPGTAASSHCAVVVVVFSHLNIYSQTHCLNCIFMDCGEVVRVLYTLFENVK